MSFLDLSGVEMSEREYKQIVPGDYHVAVKECKVEDTKSGSGKFLKATFTVAKGEFKGTYITHRFNIVNTNPEAVKIGKEQLKAVMNYAGKGDVLDHPNDLCGAQVMAHVKMRSYNGKEYPEIKWFNKVENAASGVKNFADDIPVFNAKEDLPF